MGSVIALTNLQLEHEQKAAFIDHWGLFLQELVWLGILEASCIFQ